MAQDVNSDVAVVWVHLSRLWGHVAVTAAIEVARPRWVGVKYQEKPDLMAQAVADGGQWLSTSLTTITQLSEARSTWSNVLKR
eukprot:9077955-Pyramimonas_sp.AAC.1